MKTKDKGGGDAQMNNDLQQLQEDVKAMVESAKAGASAYQSTREVAQKTMTMLQLHGDGTVVPMINMLVPIMNCEKEYVTPIARSLMDNLMQEFGGLEAESFSREGSSKQYGTFLTALSEHCQFTMINCISHLFKYMEGDSYAMRNAVLHVIAEIVLKVFRGEFMSSEERQRRDKLIDYLLAHLWDINAFVRKKCIALWINLFEREAVPLSVQRELFPRICGRINDKSSLVRKEALRFMCTYLRKNPYHASMDIIERQLADCREKLESLRGAAKKDAKSKAEEEWEKMVENVGTAAEKVAKEQARLALPKVKEEPRNWDEAENDFDIPSTSVMRREESSVEASRMDDGITVYGWMVLLVKLIQRNQYLEAANFTLQLFKKFKDHPLFEDWSEADLRDENILKERIVATLRCIYISPHMTVEEKTSMSLLEAPEPPEEEEEEESDTETEPGDSSDSERTLRTCKNQLAYLQDTARFGKKLEEMLGEVSKLFKSQNQDVMEAIDFVVTCAQFRVSGSERAMRRLSGLIWKKEQSIREAVAGAFKRLYFEDQTSEHMTKESRYAVVDKLVQLVAEASESELASLEEVVAELVEKKVLGKEITSIFWERFQSKKTEVKDARACLKLIAMATKREKTVATSNMDHLLKHGLGERAEEDLGFAVDACNVLQKIGCKTDLKDSSSVHRAPFRLKDDEGLFERLKTLLIGGFTRLEDEQWTPFMEGALNVIFFLSEHPDHTCEQILISVLQLVKEAQKSQDIKLKSITLVRLFNLIGHFGLRLLIHIDVAFCGEQKRRAYVLEMQNSPKGKKHNTSKNNSAEEDVLDAGGSAAEDVEQELANTICSIEILDKDTAIGQASKLVLQVCSKENWRDYSPPVIIAASLALSKLSLISQSFCEESLSTFFTLLTSCPIPAVRANCMVAAGDLCFRFPNQVEPKSKRLYEMLHDQDHCVRQNCMLVLTHLILNDMIKAKGYVASIALVILDPKPEMAGLARNFFVELAGKGNAVYNLMPDIISRLSDPSSKVDTNPFQDVMKFLMGFIKKERQCESLVHRICERFVGVQENRVLWQHLSFCLAQLPPYSEKALQKLLEALPAIQRILSDKTVYDNFITILNAARRGKLSDSGKETADALEDLIEKIHEEGAADEDFLRKVTRRVSKGGVPSPAFKTPKPTPRRPRNSAKPSASSSRTPHLRHTQIKTEPED